MTTALSRYDAACHALAEAKDLAEVKGIELVVRAPAARLEVRSDRRALGQILINLASNAIKFTDAGEVCLQLRRDDERGVTVFSVIDTGRGIRVEDQGRLFAAFEQIVIENETGAEGSGLGLSICQTLAATLGTSVSFVSEYGTGSTFQIEIGD